jgi:hypothetical protein
MISLGVTAPHAVAFQTALGKVVQWCRTYSQTQAWNVGTTGWADSIAADVRGQNVILSFKSSFTWAQVASGSDDARLTAIANGMMANTTRPGIIVFNHEPENDTPGAGNQPSDFKAASGHVKAVMAPLMPNWRFGPCLILDTFRTGSGRHPDDWVHLSNDVLLIDGYNWRNADTFGGGWADPAVADRTPASCFGVNINAATYAASKGMRFGFGEIGCSREQADTTGIERTAWWNLFSTYILALPAGTVEMVCHFEKDTSAVTGGDGGVVNWAIRSEPNSATAFARIQAGTTGQITFAEFEVPDPPQVTVNVTLTPGVDTDQTASAQAQISAAPNGTAQYPTIINMPAGRYRMDGGLRISGKSHIRWTTAGTMTSTWPAPPADTAVFTAYTDQTVDQRHHFELTGCTDVVGSFMRIDGPNLSRDTQFPTFAEWFGTRENEHAFSIFAGCVDCGWEDCSFNNVYGDGMYVGFQNNGVANVDCWVTRHSGLYAGRHGLGITHAVGLTVTDFRADFGGYAGVDIEPNSPNDKCWDIYLINVAVGGKQTPFTLTQGGTSFVPQKQNINLTNCSLIHCPTNSPAVYCRSPGVASTRGLTITNHSDLRQIKQFGLDIAGFDNLTVTNCDIRCGTQGSTSYALRSGNTGIVTLIGNNFSGPIAGFDQLATFTTTPTTYVHYGNTWAVGTQNDGLTPPVNGLLINGAPLSYGGSLLVRT